MDKGATKEPVTSTPAGDELEEWTKGGPAAFQRWGTDITINLGDRQLRLLSVHLKSGCWSSEQDSDSSAYRTQICTTLRNQIHEFRAWADRREDEGTAFGIIGDFNRPARRQR